MDKMRQHTLKRGTPPPLFDRIIDPKLGMPAPPILLDFTALKESILQELSLILNTRCTVRQVLYADHLNIIALFGMPEFFGLPDFSVSDFASNAQEWPKIARSIKVAIEAAEPRLSKVRVTVEGYDPLQQRLSIIVRGSVKHTTPVQDIHFPLSLSHIPSTV